MNDLKFAFRQLLKNPGFTAVAVLTLALGIGATTAIFSVVNTVLLRPLPYSEPDRLVRVYSEFPGFPKGGLRRFAVSPPEYLDLRRETKSWESLDGWASGGVNVGGGAQPTRATASQITGGLLRSLGASPLLGRVSTSEDDPPGGPPVAVISHGLWQRVFAGDREIVGRDILLNGSKCTVVGVMPKEFQFPPGDSAVARTTQGRRLVADKSVNGNAARTMSPTCGMAAEIEVLVTGFDVRVGIEVRLRREKLEGPAGLGDPGHLVVGQAIVPWLRDDEHPMGKSGRTGLQRDAHDAGFVHLDHQRFHAPSLPLGKTN